MLVDSSRDSIPGVTVTEWYQNAYIPGSAWGNGQGRGNNWTTSFTGVFFDGLGYGPGPSDVFMLNQMFTAQVGGTNYLLTTETQQFSGMSPNGTVFSNVIIKVP